MYVVIIAHRLTVFQLANFTDRAIDNTGCNTCGFYMIHNRGTSDRDITLPRSKFIICCYKHFLYNGGTNLPQNCVAETFNLITDLERKIYNLEPLIFCGQSLAAG